MQAARPEHWAGLLLTHWFRVRPPGAPHQVKHHVDHGRRGPTRGPSVSGPSYRYVMGKRSPGHIEQLPSGSWRVKVYGGTDPLTGREIGCGRPVRPNGRRRSNWAGCSSRRRLAASPNVPILSVVTPKRQACLAAGGQHASGRDRLRDADGGRIAALCPGDERASRRAGRDIAVRLGCPGPRKGSFSGRVGPQS